MLIGILLTASGFTSDILGEYLGPIEYKGYIVFDYPEGENPIINIVFTVDPTLAGNLIILNVPSPWSHSYGDGILALSGGSLSQGGSVRVTVSLNRYFEDGEYTVSSVGMTSADEVSTASGPLLVGELYLLNLLGMASAYRYPFLTLVVGLGFLEWLLSRRKRGGALAPGLGGEGEIEQPVDTGSGTRTRERGREDGSGTTTGSEDDDDPRDTPPPTIYGEELGEFQKIPPVYIISDFHIGSNNGDRTLSNDMDVDTLGKFIEWLDWVEHWDVPDEFKFDEYVVIMNGDFLDLWQAGRIGTDSDKKRLKDIKDTNSGFFEILNKTLKSKPRMKFYYIVGNHDDAFSYGLDFKKSGFPTIITSFSHVKYDLWVEHGHKNDTTNSRGKDKKPSKGQEVTEFINKMQEDSPKFRHLDAPPYDDAARYVKCLYETNNLTNKEKELAMQFVDLLFSTKGDILGPTIQTFMSKSDEFNKIIEILSPKNDKETYRGEAKKLFKSKNAKIVSLGHSHYEDFIHAGNTVYVNSGTWLYNTSFKKKGKKCSLIKNNSDLPFVKISNPEPGKALVEGIFFRSKKSFGKAVINVD